MTAETFTYHSKFARPGPKFNLESPATSVQFGEKLPLREGLALLADYLDGLSSALERHGVDAGFVQHSIVPVLPLWAAFVRGIGLNAASRTAEAPAEYSGSVRARHRAALIDRIADRFADGALADLPDVLLIIVNRALDRDMSGVHEFSHCVGYRALPSSNGVSHE